MNLTVKMAYLKHVGELQSTRVGVVLRPLDSLKDARSNLIVGGKQLAIRIHKHEFYTFEDALHYLQRDAQRFVKTQNVLGDL